jgi:hypothetical protein
MTAGVQSLEIIQETPQQKGAVSVRVGAGSLSATRLGQEADDPPAGPQRQLNKGDYSLLIRVDTTS